MNARQSPPRGRRAGIAARAALSLYPPAWRARYGDEVRALLEDSGDGPRAVVPAVYLVATFVIARLVSRPSPPVGPWQSGPVADLANGGVGPRWFLALVVLGFAAAVLAAAGPALALPGLRPEGPAVVLASAVAVVSATLGIRAARPPAVA
jgi:hypothetical protein